MVKSSKIVKKNAVKKGVKNQGRSVKPVFVDAEYEKEQTRKDKAESKRDRNFFFAVGVIVLIIIGLIIAGVMLRNYNANKYTYNNFNFYKEGNLWQTVIEREGALTVVPFHYHPTDLESYIFEPGIEYVFSGFNGTVFITLDPNLNSTVVKAGIQVARITGERFDILNIPTFSAITNFPDDFVPGNETNGSRIITCQDADNETIVVWLKKGSVNAVYSNGNCVIIEGVDEEALVMGAEKLNYVILGIM